MGRSGFEEYARGIALGTTTDSEVITMLDFVDARLEDSDHRMLMLLKLLCATAELLPAALRGDIERCAVGFRYDVSDAGGDAMRIWTESHYLVCAVSEYLAGQLFTDKHFSGDHMSGRSHLVRAGARLRRWLTDRFRFGFSEWLSPDSYSVNVAALAVLIDHADDRDLVTRAEMVLDLIFLDLALHSFSGRFVSASAIETTRADPASGIARILNSTFATAPACFDLTRPDTAFLFRDRYRVPDAVMQIARDRSPRRVVTSQGLDLTEVVDELAQHPFDPRTELGEIGRFFWAQSALVTPESLDATFELVSRYDLWGQRPFASLGQYRRAPRQLRRAMLATLDPIVAGAATQRGNVFTYRGQEFILSSAQSYHAGEWGHQQNLWTAMLGSDVVVFGNHPGATTLGGDFGPPAPSRWVGNGINPEIGQRDNVLLALHHLRHRRGMFEGRRYLMSHVHFPVVKFDETRLGPRFAVGRRAGAYIGIVSLEPLELVSETELVQRGELTGYAVVLADITQYASLALFTSYVKRCRLTLRGDTLSFQTPDAGYLLRWHDGMRVGGHRLDTQFPRYRSTWLDTPRNPTVISIKTPSAALRLDLAAGVREQG